MKHTLLMITALMLVVGCSKNTVTDIDDNTYKTVQIGDQIWMAENLKVTHYRNGDPIPTGHSDSVWISLSTGAYAVYDGNESNADTYGYLYNWYAVNDSRNLAPEGWHVPTGDEWRTLVDYLGGKDVAGGKLKEVGTTYWSEAGGTDESKFHARGAGTRSSYNGAYEYRTYLNWLWSSEEYSSSNGWYFEIYYATPYTTDSQMDKQNGMSIRCVKD